MKVKVELTQEEYNEFRLFSERNKPKRKRGLFEKRCPTCGYRLDNGVPPQRFCDRCGQRVY